MTKTLYFLNINSAMLIVDRIKKDNDAVVIAFDNKSERVLENIGIQYSNPDRYLSQRDYNSIDIYAQTIARGLTGDSEINSVLNLMHVPLLHLVFWELNISLVKQLKRIFDVNTIIEKERPSHVISFIDDSILGMIPKKLCEKKGISFEGIVSKSGDSVYHYDKIRLSFDIGGKPRNIEVSKRNYNRIKDFVDKSTKSMVSFSRLLRGNVSKEKKVVCLDFDITKYNFMLRLMAEHGYEITLINSRKPVIWNLDSLKFMMRSDLDFGMLNDFADRESLQKISDSTQKMNEQFTISWEGGRKHFDACNTIIWDLVEHDLFNTISDRFQEGIRYILLGGRMLDIKKPFMLLCRSDLMPFERAIIIQGKRRGIKSLIIQDGIAGIPRFKNFEWRNFEFSELMADEIAAWGKLQKEYWEYNGATGERVHEIGCPRYDTLFRSTIPPFEQYMGCILLATSGLPTSFSYCNSNSIVNRYEEFILSVCEAVKRIAGERLVLKLHPWADEIIDVVTIAKNIIPSITVVRHSDMYRLIQSCKMLISTESTVVLEAIAMNKPTIVWKTIDGSLESEHIPYVASGVSIGVEDKDQMELAIRKILKHINTSYSTNDSKIFLNNMLANRGTASHALIQLLDDSYKVWKLKT